MKYFYITLITFLTITTSLYSQNFYDMNTINTVEITFEESNWDYLLDQLASAGEEERLVGSVSINGQVFDSAGIRYKGNSTYNANQIKNPFNIKLDHIIDQTIDGYGTLKLSNVYKDPSFIRETMAYEIARNYMPASQSNYANVYVNGTHLGLYTSDQSVDKFFMRTHFASDENTRVKGELTSNGGPPSGGVWEYYGQDSSLYANYYEIKSDYGWLDLIEFLDVLNNENENIDDYLNIDRHLWFLAWSNLLVNLDGPINNPQNYYLYKDDAGRFNPIPWDLNESFGGYSNHQTLGNLGTSQLQQLNPLANLNESEFPVISKILTNEEYRKIYTAHMKTIIEENISNSAYETRALEIQDIIDADVQADPNKFYSYSNFISNVYNSVGGGPQSVIGIVQLMDARADYILSLTDFQYEAPEISNVQHSPENVSPNTEVFITAEVFNTANVYLAYRSGNGSRFEKVMMFDDGLHEDGDAGDGIFGTSINAGSTDIQYYIFAENDNAVALSPVRAEYEFYSISINGNLVINEFMADNENTVADQDGDYDDWIELYNNGNDDINLNGYYLSDDASDPYQWTFPDTTLMTGEYLIVWADKDETQEGLHANFKLSKSGETIVLSSNNQELLDEISFLEQKTDTSYGRFPNGTGEFFEMLPTFGQENTGIITSVNDGIEMVSTDFVLHQNRPNPFNSTTTIEFSLNESDMVTLGVYNSYGNLIKTLVSQYLPDGNHSYLFESEGISKGLYFYTLDVGGNQKHKKMIIQ